MAQDQASLVFTMDKLYQLKNDGSAITLNVIIGDMGQSPDMDVKLNTKKLLEGHNESVKNLSLGIDKDLTNKVLRITGNVVDSSADSNKIEVTVKLKGGLNDLSKKFSVTVEEDGEEVDIAFIIRFF